MATHATGWQTRLVAAVGTLALVPAALAPASDGGSAPVFEARVEAISVNVVVTRGRRPVTGLERADFRVFEDGVPQEIAFVLEEEELALSVVIMVDGSSSMKPVLPVAQAAALHLVDALGPRDRARVVRFDRHVSVVQEFTSDRAALAGALRGIEAEGETALYTSLYVVLKELGQIPAADDERRAVVLLTDGVDASSSLRDEDVLELAADADVAVYPIALRAESLLRNHSSDVADHFLTALAAYTGASVHFPESAEELHGIYATVARELRTQYCLGYVPSNPRRDGKWRTIAVLAPPESSLSVRHKRGYRAPAP